MCRDCSAELSDTLQVGDDSATRPHQLVRCDSEQVMAPAAAHTSSTEADWCARTPEAAAENQRGTPPFGQSTFLDVSHSPA